MSPSQTGVLRFRNLALRFRRKNITFPQDYGLLFRNFFQRYFIIHGLRFRNLIASSVSQVNLLPPAHHGEVEVGFRAG